MKLSILIPVYNQENLVIKALDNIPRRDDIEVLVRDDGSTDSTLTRLLDYVVDHTDLNLSVFSNGENKGVAYTKNRLLEDAKGKYFHIHDSDDFCLKDAYNTVIDMLDEADVYCFDLIINNGTIFHLNSETDGLYCAQIARFIRKDFAQGITFPEHIRAADDWYFANDLTARKPNIVYTGIVAYRYNYPREGSLSDLKAKGLV